jgi:hypothetical protein
MLHCGATESGRSTHWSAGDGSGRDNGEKDGETHIGVVLGSLGDATRRVV